jgi:hypothetical protein
LFKNIKLKQQTPKIPFMPGIMLDAANVVSIGSISIEKDELGLTGGLIDVSAD